MSTFAPLKQKPVQANDTVPPRKAAPPPKRSGTIAIQGSEDPRFSATRDRVLRQSRPVANLVVLRNPFEAEHAPIQTKLEVSQPSDDLEQEADHTAEQVMHAPQQDVAPEPVMRMPDTSMSRNTTLSAHPGGSGEPRPSPPELLQREQAMESQKN